NVAYAQGIKRYVNLTYGELYNTSLSAEYPIFDFLSVDGSVSYHRGKDNHHNNLPMISPLAYTAGIHFQKEGYSAALNLNSNGTQRHYDADFGERHTDSYHIFSADVGKQFILGQDEFYVKAGAENIFDQNYTTYNDWDKIPQMGRNFYLNLTYNFN